MLVYHMIIKSVSSYLSQIRKYVCAFNLFEIALKSKRLIILNPFHLISPLFIFGATHLLFFFILASKSVTVPSGTEYVQIML